MVVEKIMIIWNKQWPDYNPSHPEHPSTFLILNYDYNLLVVVVIMLNSHPTMGNRCIGKNVSMFNDPAINIDFFFKKLWWWWLLLLERGEEEDGVFAETLPMVQQLIIMVVVNVASMKDALHDDDDDARVVCFLEDPPLPFLFNVTISFSLFFPFFSTVLDPFFFSSVHSFLLLLLFLSFFLLFLGSNK